MECPIAMVNFFLLLLLDVRFICAIFGVEMFVCEPGVWTNNCEMPQMKCALLSFYYRFCSLAWCSIVHFTSNNTFCILFEVLLCTSERLLSLFVVVGAVIFIRIPFALKNGIKEFIEVLQGETWHVIFFHVDCVISS